jgi:hypothetical protein
MDELIARLEAATGPDRQLDVDIFVEVAWTGQGDERTPPAYTSSIDAALTLVPEGFDHRSGSFDGGKSFNAVVTTPELSVWNWDIGCDKAPTQAISLCIAALKARKQP